MISDLLAGWRFALRRLAASWRFMLVAALGVLVAATLLAMTPIYAAAMSDLGLRFRLDRELDTPERRLAEIVMPAALIGDSVAREQRAAVDAITRARVGWLGDGLLTESRSQRFDVSFPDFDDGGPTEVIEVPAGTGEPVRQRWGGYLYVLGGMETRVEVVEGRMPSDGTIAEIVLPDGYQRHAVLGDTIRIVGARFTDCPSIPPSEDAEEALDEVRCEPTARVSTHMDITVVGFVRPRNPADPAWAIFEGEWGAPDAPILPRIDGPASVSPDRFLIPRGIGQMPLLTTQPQLDGVFARLLPESSVRHRSGVMVETGRLAVPEVERAVDDLHAWVDDVNTSLRVTATSRMGVADVLARYRNAQTFTAVPLLIVLLQVVGIVGYYVVMVMALLLERQAEEIGVYRSRGATSAQLLGLNLVEGVVFAVPAALAAPWLAAGVVSVLGRTPAFLAVTGGAALPARVTPEAYLLGIAGATLALLAILLPALVVVRRGIVDVKREESRPPGRSAFQRYYLDLAVVALAAILLWQLEQRGSVFDPGSVGGWSSDPMLMLAPLAITAAVASIVLRIYPPMVRVASRLMMLMRGTAAAVGLRRAGRAPAAYARVTLLLIMATSVGAFAASYGPTVGQSLEDRAEFRSGVDVRGLLYDGANRDLAAQVAEVLTWEGVAGGAAVHRGGIATTGGNSVQVIGIDPDYLAEHLWWRDDFAEQPLDALMGLLRTNVTPGVGLLIPAESVAIEIDARTPSPARNYLRARFRDASGDIFDAPFDGTPGAGEEWGTLRALLPVDAARPLTFSGVLIGDRLGQNLRVEGAMDLDRLVAVNPTGDRAMVEGFDGAFRWMLLAPLNASEKFEVATDAGDERLARWTWASTVVPRVRLLTPVDPAIPLAVLMDSGALSAFGAVPGGIASSAFGGVSIPLHVRETFNLFPTTSTGSGLVIVNIADLRSAARLTDVAPPQYPTELWLTFEPGLSIPEQQAIVARLLEPSSPVRLRAAPELRAAAHEAATADPTLQASGSGILSVAFIAVLGLSTIGFVVTLVVGARQRAVEFAVLKALGTSPRQVLRALLLEWSVVLVLGLGVGAFAGRQLAKVMLGFLGVTEQGAPVLPPFVIVTDWRALALGLGVLAGVALGSLLLAWLAAMRRPATVELRLTR
ncbi:MAG: FtsX-like permease family protein [Chloroflexi bacterium]|nr:FtsX-like permease family protein [Chloroflexota bacterium]